MKQIAFDDFLEAIVKAHSGMDVTTCWPAHPAQIEACMSDLIAMRVFNKYREDKTKFLDALSKVPIDCVRSYLYQAGLVGLKVARVLTYLGHKITVEESTSYI